MGNEANSWGWEEILSARLNGWNVLHVGAGPRGVKNNSPLPAGLHLALACGCLSPAALNFLSLRPFRVAKCPGKFHFLSDFFPKKMHARSIYLGTDPTLACPAVFPGDRVETSCCNWFQVLGGSPAAHATKSFVLLSLTQC